MKRLVLKIGGSVLYDKNLQFNVELIEKIASWFKGQKDYGQVVFVIGGGRLSRFLLNQVKEEIDLDSPKHQIGIRVTRVNAVMVFGLFNNEDVKSFDSLEKLCHSLEKGNAKGAIIGGIAEGWSTDVVAAHIANNLGVNVVNKISDIDYIYDADPDIERQAKPLKFLTWDEYINLFNSQIGEKHEPGMSAPIDIKCSKFCKKNKISFRVCGGKLLKEKVEVDELLKSGTLVS